MTVPAADAGLVLAKMKGCGVPCVRIGTTGGDAIAVAGEDAGLGGVAEDRVRKLVAGLYERRRRPELRCFHIIASRRVARMRAR